ncbi:MAG: permease [bacterium]|nr:permease [bacterium]
MSKNQFTRLISMMALFGGAYFLPLDSWHLPQAVQSSLALTKWYAREHVILCLIPALFIAGAISTFIQSGEVMKHLGAGANKLVAYGVASVSGSVLAVCSCTVLPLFGGIYKMGAGIGPATAFLYAGPAINVLAIVLTARVLGLSMGIARTVGAVLFSIIIGLLMAWLFRRDEVARLAVAPMEKRAASNGLRTAVWFATLSSILVAATLGPSLGIYPYKWWLTGGLAVLLCVQMAGWMQTRLPHLSAGIVVTIGAAVAIPDYPQAVFLLAIAALSLILYLSGGRSREWLEATWDFSKQIVPLLLLGILAAGLLLGQPGSDGLIPSSWIAKLVGGNSLVANFISATIGAFMYFATLTEVPILQGLMSGGMGAGPGLALLLAGPALSLPSMLVIHSLLGLRKTVAFVSLVVTLSTLAGWLYGNFV